MDAFIYTRVSTSEQVTDGVSLDTQEAQARKWAEANGYTVAGTFTDAGLSGKRMKNRPALQSALDAVCSSKGALVVYSLSRMARSTKDALTIAERLDKAGADFVSLTERIDTSSAAGKMLFRVLAVLAEFERDLISERTKAVFSFKRSKGERIGEIPFGYTLAANGIDMSSDPIEQATLADLRCLRAAGTSWQHIADELNARGIPTKKGKTWTLHNARKIALAA